MTTNIVIADDHGLVRAGLRMLLNGEPDFCVVGEAEDGQSALRIVGELEPDVLIADVSMPPPTGIELAALLRSRESATRVLIVTMHEDHALAMEAKQAGAAGYLTKRSLEAELSAAVRAVAPGGSYWQLDAESGQARGHEEHAAPEILGDADRRLLRLVVNGYTDRQIAEELGQSREAVEKARLALMGRLGLHSRASLLRFAQDHGLV